MNNFQIHIMKSKIKVSIGKCALLMFAILLFVGCKGNEEKTGIIINMAYSVNGKELEVEKKLYPTKAGHTYEVHRLKYYLSDIALEDEHGNSVLLDNAHLFDILRPSSNTFTFGQIPLRSYKKLSFVFGLDESKCKEGGLPNTIENNRMEWPVPGEKGYHYMKFEGKYDSLNTGVMKNFNLHTGPTKNNKNYVHISLDLPKIKAGKPQFKITLDMDLDKIIHGPNNYDFAMFGQGIMANQKAQAILKQNMQNVFTIKSINR